MRTGGWSSGKKSCGLMKVTLHILQHDMGQSEALAVSANMTCNFSQDYATPRLLLFLPKIIIMNGECHTKVLPQNLMKWFQENNTEVL